MYRYVTMLATAVVSTFAVGSIGTKIFVETFTITCTKTLELMTHLATNTHPGFEEINTLLNECDLKAKVMKIQQLIIEMTANQNLKVSVQMAIGDLNEAIYKIQGLLQDVNHLKEYHQTLYFNRWRTPNCTPFMNAIRCANHLLDSRFGALEKIVSISQVGENKV